MLRVAVAAMAVLSLLGTPRSTRADGGRGRFVPDGASLVRLLGPRAIAAFAPPGAPGLGALVRLPKGAHASDFGLRAAAPGIARLWSSPEGVVAFGLAHPDLPIEIVPPPHLLLDTASAFVDAPAVIAAGLDGSGSVVGIADTGIDVTHPDFLDASGKTRVAWLLDLGSAPRGKWPDLEHQYGITDPSSGMLVAGAVWSADNIDAALAAGQTSTVSADAVGHGTLVTSCAAGSGASGRTPYRGIAPGATIVFARITDANWNLVGSDAILGAVDFLFDRADAMNMPVVVNLSFGSDFGPHDGTLAWEQALASHVGPNEPGHSLIAAAGNSGAIVPNPVHENVAVSPALPVAVPIVTHGAHDGGVQVWVAMHHGASLRVGLNGPDGVWIAPVAPGASGSVTKSDYSATVVSGSAPEDSPVPPLSLGAVVAWQGSWPSGTYNVTLTGSGTADLYIEGNGDAVVPPDDPFGFAYGVREATINIPATSPSIISVGCTINKTKWTDESGLTYPPPLVPVLDSAGGMATGDGREAAPGEPCWFSSAGPNLVGMQKPEIMAPGAFIVGALSREALPPGAESIFSCPFPDDKDPTCLRIDFSHAVSAGTSFSAPIVAGAVAVLLQRNPRLTQEQILAALQGGAHPLRGPHPYDDQAGVGELDVAGAITAVDRMSAPELTLPLRSESWLTLGADSVLADGSTMTQAVLELRGSPTDGNVAPPADGFDGSRLAMVALVDGAPMAGLVSVSRRGPGVWIGDITVPAGLVGFALTVGATFDGSDLVDRKTVPIAADTWAAEYPVEAHGGCSVSSRGGRPPSFPSMAMIVLGVAVLPLARRRRLGVRPVV
jgi:subtilisin family serine protease